MRYTAKGAKPRRRTQAMKKATERYATMKDTAKPMASTTHCSGVIWDKPIGFSPLPASDFSSVYPVAASMVGMDRKKENSSAAARDMPANCPAAMVDIDRETPGKTAERIWQAPIQTAWKNDMVSMRQVWIRLPAAPGPALSQRAFLASTTHMTMPPISREAPIM